MIASRVSEGCQKDPRPLFSGFQGCEGATCEVSDSTVLALLEPFPLHVPMSTNPNTELDQRAKPDSEQADTENPAPTEEKIERNTPAADTRTEAAGGPDEDSA